MVYDHRASVASAFTDILEQNTDYFDIFDTKKGWVEEVGVTLIFVSEILVYECTILCT